MRVGDVIKIAEADYCYGVGDLVLRVTAYSVAQMPAMDGHWFQVRGIEIAWNGQELGERQVMVRRSALP